MLAPPRCAAFTLIELLTVIAVVGVLAAILIPAVGSVRKSANNVECVANLRSQAQAVLLYAGDVGRFPSNGYGSLESNNFSYDIDILPYMGIDTEALADFKAGRIRRSDPVAGSISGLAKAFYCPSDDVVRTNPDYFPRSYALVPWTFNWSNGSSNRGPAGSSLPKNSGIPPILVGDPSNAAILVESHMPLNQMGALSNATGDGPGVSADGDIHGANCNVAFADGSVRTFDRESITTGEFILKYWGGASITQD